MKKYYQFAVIGLLATIIFMQYRILNKPTHSPDQVVSKDNIVLASNQDLIYDDTLTRTQFGIFGDGDTFAARGFNVRAVDGNQIWIYHVRDRNMKDPAGGNQSNGMGVRDMVTHESANMGIEFRAGTPNTYNTCSQYMYPGPNSSITNKLLVGDEGVSIDFGSTLFHNRSFQMFRDDKTVFAVAETGGMIINGVNYSFPKTQAAANTQLVNDGQGNLTWRQQNIWNDTKIDSVAVENSLVNLTAHSSNMIIAAGAINKLTVNLPASPANGDMVGITYTQTIASLSYQGGRVIAGGPLTAVPVGPVKLQYVAARKVWYGW